MADLSEEDLTSCLKEADALVQRALRALHKEQVSRRKSEALVGSLLDEIMNETWRTILIHNEWRQVEARVEAMRFERRRQSKGETRKAKCKTKAASVASSSSLEMSVRAAVQDVHLRTIHYKRTANAVANNNMCHGMCGLQRALAPSRCAIFV